VISSVFDSLGLRGWNPDAAYNGFTLFTPLGPASRTVYLIDMEGTVVHAWQMPYAPGQYGYLTERGTLFCNGQVPNPNHLGRVFQGGAALEADWGGNILWGRSRDGHC
jgi:hypothetical protein